MGGGVAAGPVWVVVWPFSSVERERMTLPPGCCRGGVGGGLGLGWDGQEQAEDGWLGRPVNR
jgi:hypothetical protein